MGGLERLPTFRVALATKKKRGSGGSDSSPHYDHFKDHLQIFLLKISKFEQINWLVLSGNHRKNTGLFFQWILAKWNVSFSENFANVLNGWPLILELKCYDNLFKITFLNQFFLSFFFQNKASLFPVLLKTPFICIWESIISIHRKTYQLKTFICILGLF